MANSWAHSLLVAPTVFLETPPEGPSRARFLLAHGSGQPCTSPFMEQAAQALASVGLHVYRFNFRFIERPRPPDRMPKLLLELEDVLSRWHVSGPRLVGGKSLGARVTLEVADRFDGWLALGYPFHPPGQPEKTRLDGFSRLQATPGLIVQGTRDPFGRPPEVEGYGLSTPIHWLQGGDHAFLGCEQPFEQLKVILREWLDKVLPMA